MSHQVRVVAQENKILAVKLVREMSGMGLRDSLDHVESGAYFETRCEDMSLRRMIEEGGRSGVAFEFVPPLAGVANLEGGAVVVGPRGEWAVRYRSGANKIPAIKLARELQPEFGLAEAKHVVEQQGLVMSGIGRDEAEQIVARFAELGSVVELERAVTLPSPSAGQASAPAVYGRTEDDDF